MMQYRRLGRSGLTVSAVGFGTCQLRRVPQQQAIDTLKRGFELGVNLVHTAPDYEGAEELVAQAVRESGRDVIVLSQGYGDLAHFEWLFESTCRRYGQHRLPMFGIACIDDREYLGEPVWGPGGAVEFLAQKKREGRLGATFCTTHGPPEYIARLIQSNAFDAIMLAYNTLGFHLLSYHPDASRPYEHVERNGAEIFPLAALHDVGLMIMKPLAGGLLCEGKAFPPRGNLGWTPRLTAGDVLRGILAHPEVSCVVPGTASVAEAEENARAGHDASVLTTGRTAEMTGLVDAMKASVCSRCGRCDDLCSKHLPVSWLFRDAYISHFPSETFETIDRLRYFALHPSSAAACSTCTDVTCACPYGIDIPASLIKIHGEMIARRDEGVLPEPTAEIGTWDAEAQELSVSLVARELPRALRPGERAVCRVYVQNTGAESWRSAPRAERAGGVELAVYAGGRLLQTVPLRHDVEPGARVHFAFELAAPRAGASFALRLALRRRRRFLSGAGVEITRQDVAVTTGGQVQHVS